MKPKSHPPCYGKHFLPPLPSPVFLYRAWSLAGCVARLHFPSTVASCYLASLVTGPLHADSSCGGARVGHLQHISNAEAVYCIPSSNCEVSLLLS